VRLEIVQLPQSVHRVLADLLLLCHEPATPMGHALGLATQGRLNDPVSRGLIVLRFAPSSGGNLPDLSDALLADPLAPQLHGGPHVEAVVAAQHDAVGAHQPHQVEVDLVVVPDRVVGEAAQVKEAFTNSFVPVTLSKSPEEFQEFVQVEAARWARIVREYNVRLE